MVIAYRKALSDNKEITIRYPETTRSLALFGVEGHPNKQTPMESPSWHSTVYVDTIFLIN